MEWEEALQVADGIKALDRSKIQLSYVTDYNNLGHWCVGYHLLADDLVNHDPDREVWSLEQWQELQRDYTE